MTDRYDDGNRSSGAVLTALASSGLAVVAVLVLVGVLFLVFGERSDQAGLTAQPDGPADPGLIPRPADSASPSPSRSPSDIPTNGAVATPADVEVVVLNATGRKGLAARFAERLTASGWKVAAVGNFRGNVPATTVYYPTGKQQAAEALDAQFEGVDRIRPAFSGISQTRLTVILTREFPGS
jgi:hypothetical protein